MKLFLLKLWPVIRTPRVWVPVACIIVTACLADGVIAQTGKLHDFAVAFLDIAGKLGLWTAAGAGAVGVVAAGHWQLPRKSLAEMSDLEREDLFKKFPQVKERWEAQQATLANPPREAS